MFPLTVLLVMVSGGDVEIPPPLLALLPLMVLPVISRVPDKFKIPPPLAEAVFPLTVLLVRIRVVKLWMPPPP